MITAEGLILLALAGLLGAVLAWLISAQRYTALNRQLAHNQQLAAQKLEQLQYENQQLIRTEASLKQTVASLEQQQQQLDTTISQLQLAIDSWRDKYYASQQNYTKLEASHQEKLATISELQQTFEHSKAQMRLEFQNLAQQILEEKGKTFSQTSQSSLASLLQPFREQIAGFQKRINDVHDASARSQSLLMAEINQVHKIGLQMSAEATNLTSALKGDKKTTGNWGEIQLERSLQLAGLVAGEHYQAQASFQDDAGNRRQPDFVIKLPDNKHIVIDSKVSLVDYDRAIAATSDHERQLALQAHVQAVRNHITDLADKDYSSLIGMRSPNFVLMFMPIEPAYIEAMKQNRELFDYGYQRNVIMVSHTTLMPILRTVANLWMMARSNEEAKNISDMAGDIYNNVITVAERLHKLGNTLNTVNSHYNNTVTALVGQQGLYNRVNRFAELSTRANKKMPALEPKEMNVEIHKLKAVLPDTTGQQQNPNR